MAAADVGGLPARTLERAEIDSFLRSQGHGVLSLAAAGEAYGFPVSFGYDGETLYFVFQRPREESRKEVFANETTTASFLAYAVEGKADWTSVIATGPLRSVGAEEWPTLLAAVEANAWYPDLFSATEPMQDFLGFALTPESVTGLSAR
ncbi:pyridoxamine 5'-phosphate oxidase family protein [Natronomonas sp. EA1]|uniref:pyridoxamine 5'-phosphate oxidase family protein n=1 Tax=Natronomonas sp. EA1 TaxID=3421655 RepID=UPI003EBD5976